MSGPELDECVRSSRGVAAGESAGAALFAEPYSQSLGWPGEERQDQQTKAMTTDEQA